MAVDDHLQVQIAFGDDAFTASPTWVDVTSYVRSFDLHTSRRSPQVDTFQGGYGMIRLDGNDREMDPYYASSTYAGDFTYGTPVRVRSSTTIIWAGFAASWRPVTTSHDTVTELEVMDGISLAAEVQLTQADSAALALESVNSRIGSVLDLMGWPSGKRDLANCDTLLRAGGDNGGTALQEMVMAALADGGFVFHDPNTDDIVFEGRNAIGNNPRRNTSQHTFGAGNLTIADGTLTHAAIGRDFFNQVEVQIVESFWTTVTDPDTYGTWEASDWTFGSVEPPKRSYREVKIVNNAGESLATFLLAIGNTTDPYPIKWTTVAAIGSSAQNTGVRDVRLRDQATVQWDPVGPGGTVSVPVFIESIQHKLSPQNVWTATFEASPAGPYNELAGPPTDWLVLDDLTRGQLDNNDLGY